MANPIFSKTGTPDVTLSQAPDLRSTFPLSPRQTVQRTYAGLYKVLTRGVRDEIFNLSFQELPASDADDLVTFFGSAVVNYAERPFTYTDENSVAHQLRYLDSNLPGVTIAPDVRRLNLTFTIDRGPLD